MIKRIKKALAKWLKAELIDLALKDIRSTKIIERPHKVEVLEARAVFIPNWHSTNPRLEKMRRDAAIEEARNQLLDAVSQSIVYYYDSARPNDYKETISLVLRIVQPETPRKNDNLKN